jgi:hypothetical protein
MKLSQLTKPLLATAIALSVGTLQILPASAQTGTASGSAGTTNSTGTGSSGSGSTGTTDSTGTSGTSGTGSTGTTTIPDTTAPSTTTTDPSMTTTTPVDRNDGFNWGWLGLLGLIGLAGLRKPEDREVYRDPGVVDPARTATRTTDYNR